MRQYYKKLIRNMGDYGPWVTLGKVISRVFKLVYEHRVYRIYGLDLQTYQPREFGPKGFDFRFLSRESQNLIAQIEDKEEWLHETLADKFAKGSLCLVALDGERLAGFNLVSFNKVPIPLLEMDKDLPPDEAWSEQITVLKEYRKNNLGSELRYRVFNELKRRGFRRICGGTLSSNAANLALSRRVGFQELVDVHYTKVFHFKKWNYKEVTDDSV
jgi:GNAT superfamily N-acetyltransferase